EIVQTNTNTQTNNTTSNQNGRNNETSRVANNYSIEEQSVNPNPESPISNDGIAETNDDNQSNQPNLTTQDTQYSISDIEDIVLLGMSDWDAISPTTDSPGVDEGFEPEIPLDNPQINLGIVVEKEDVMTHENETEALGYNKVLDPSIFLLPYQEFDLTTYGFPRATAYNPLITASRPKRVRWFVETGLSMDFIPNPQTNMLENEALINKITRSKSAQFQIGVKYGRFSVSSGIGQSQFTNQLVAKTPPIERIDTLSSYYALVTNEYKHFEKVVSLIERRYVTQSYIDSNDKGKTYAAKSRIQYLTIPMSIGYTLPLGRFEFTTNVAVDFMVKPKLMTDAPTNFSALMDKNQTALRPSLVRPNVNFEVGYRFNSNWSTSIQIKRSWTDKTVYVGDQENVKSFGANFGLMYRF
ncbi:MAG: hypothetical protein ACI8SE_001984, partial [Bacteroidia bacterium]